MSVDREVGKRIQSVETNDFIQIVGKYLSPHFSLSDAVVDLFVRGAKYIERVLAGSNSFDTLERDEDKHEDSHYPK